MPSLTLHGHFYQPPRENPWTDEIDREPTAEPYHDWNERIAEECYRPNAFARVFGGDGRVVDILNNYEYLSFNFGPTLLSWLRQYAPDVYERLKHGDAASLQRLGHGNAIAQAYNHLIMPLANARDKVTQVRWGLADFRFHFGREAEAMWLPETAVDYDTLEVLATHGMQYVILAPSQAARVKPLDSHEWQDARGGNLDPSRAYLCRLPSGRSLAAFFYDGPLSHAAGYGDLFRDSQRFVAALAGAVDPSRSHPQLIHLATDGETFGHHKKFAELTLIYALTHEAPAHGFTVTNYAADLAAHPPQWEVEIKNATAWSCAHGVGRWSRDCSCNAGAPASWHQRWRAPLRLALDNLRDSLAQIYEREAPALLGDPWAARNAYGECLPARDPEHLEAFLARCARRALTATERERALTLLEMQRHALLMYASCGWFFNDLSGLETAQVLKYAARAIDLAAHFDHTGADLSQKLLADLKQAESNEPRYGDGVEVYRQLVLPVAIGPERVAASYAISALIDPFPVRHRRHAYRITETFAHARLVGDYRFVCGHIQLTSDYTSQVSGWTYAAVHLGGYNCAASVMPSPSSQVSEELCLQLLKRLHRMTPPKMARLLQGLAARVYALGDLPPSDRRRLMKTLEQDTLAGLANSYEQIYTQHMATIHALREANMTVPPELRVAAEYTLSHRLAHAATELARDPQANAPDMQHILDLAARYGLRLERGWTHRNLEQAVVEHVKHIVAAPRPTLEASAFTQLTRLIETAGRLGFALHPARAQEMLLDYLRRQPPDLPYREAAAQLAEALHISSAAIQ